MSNKGNPTRTLYSRPDYLEAMDAAAAEHDEIRQKTGRKNSESHKSAERETTPTIEDNTSNNTATSEDEDLSYKERWKNSKKYYDSEIHKARQRIEELEQQQNGKKFTPPKTQEEMEAFRKQYSDMYDAMLTVSHGQANELTSQLASEVNNLKQKLAETEVEKALQLIQARHPDYQDIVMSENFTAWLDTQDPNVRSWVENNQSNATTFNRALDLYKMDTGITPSKGHSKSSNKSDTPNQSSTKTNKSSNSAADDVRVSGSAKAKIGETKDKIWTRAEIGKLHPSEYAKYEAEIDAALLEGRVI